MTTTKKQFLNYYTFLAIGYGFLLLSFFYGHYKDDGSWFSRAGSVLVIFSVIVEYRIVMNRSMQNTYAPGIQKTIIDLPSGQHLTGGEKVVKHITHLSLLFGTLVWGYGDLII